MLPGDAVELNPQASLTPEELTRYSRHLTLPQVGVDGQLKLKSARVLLIGAGGLGVAAGTLPGWPRASERSDWWSSMSLM